MESPQLFSEEIWRVNYGDVKTLIGQNRWAGGLNKASPNGRLVTGEILNHSHPQNK